MSKKQSNLDSFFGVTKEKRVQTQAKLTFGKKTDEEKENRKIVVKDSPNDDDSNDDTDEVVVVAKSSKKKQSKKKRRIIVDDDEDEEEKSVPTKGSEPSHAQERSINEPPPKKEATPIGEEEGKKTTSSSKKLKKEDSSEAVEENQNDEEMKVNPEEFEGAAKADQLDDDMTQESDETTNEQQLDDEIKVKPENFNETTKEDLLDMDMKVVKEEKPTQASMNSFFKKQMSSVATNTKTEKETTTTTKPTMKLSLSKSDHLSYNTFCETMEQIEAITGRLDIQALLTTLFSAVLQTDHPQDLYDLIYLSSNSVAPSYECIELGIGDAILIKAIGEAYGTNPSIVKQKYESEGDLGTVAMASKGKQRTLSFGFKPKPLMAKDVLGLFREIAHTTGAQSQKWKVDKIKKLLVRAQGPEAKYIIRGLQGKLRIGLARSTVLISLAHAFAQTPLNCVEKHSLDAEEEEEDEVSVEEDVENEVIVKEDEDSEIVVKEDDEIIVKEDKDDEIPEEARLYRKNKKSKSGRNEAAVAIIKKAYSEVPSYDSLLDALLSVPLDQMHKACTLTPGIPVEPMLAKPTKSIQEVLKRLNGQRFTCEFKYDGERAQVHMLEDGSFKVFSRNLLDTSGKYPEVSQYVKEASKDDVTSYVLDTEVVAFNRETGKLVPFQVLSTRKKTEESAETAKVQVIVQAFDLMYLNGKSLLNKTLAERRDLMKEKFAPVESKFQFAESLDHKEDGDTTFLEEFLETAVKSQCEGLMVKTLDDNAAYEPSKRSLNWLKLKKDYLDGLGDSVDLVPLGAYYGRGKRTGTFGAYLLACYDAETEEFQSVCKIGTGFSDEDLKNLSESFNDHRIDRKASNYNASDSLDCDVWFDAVQVWEVKAADLSKSSTHKGAIGRTGEAGRGIGLRFPRFERTREDKKPEQATSSEQILEMYYQQDSVVNEGGGDANDDDDGI